MNFSAKFYGEHYVNSVTQRFVNKVWWLNNLNGLDDTKTHFVLPNGCHNIALIEGSGARVNTRKESYYLASGTYLASQMTAKVAVELSAKTKITLIQLQPWTLSMIFGLIWNGTADLVERIDGQFFGPTVSLDTNKKPGVEKLVLELDEHFMEFSNSCGRSLIESICNEILAIKGICKVVDIVSNYESSARTIQLAFKASTDLTLKQYIDIIKLRAAVDSISCDTDKSASVTRIAMDYHYFDQTHFIKSFKRIVKVTPSKFDKRSFLLSKIKA